MVGKLDLEQLIKECVTDISALEQVYIELKKDVFAFAYSFLSDYSLAEDCVQETFVRIPRAATKFNSSTGGKAFILAIARNVCLEFYRKNKRIISVEGNLENYSVEYKKHQENNIEDFAEKVYIDQLLSVLNKNQRIIFTLHIYSALTFVEIGSLLKTPVSTVKSRYKRGIFLLKEELERVEKSDWTERVEQEDFYEES